MAITFDDLNQVGEVVRAATTLREAAAIWRARDPAMRVLVVDAMDMRDETPVLSMGARSVYLGATNGHCWRVTGEPTEATALILAEG